MKIYLVRHGETVWNVENRIQGHLDSPVTEVGIRQISALCRDLADKSITSIIASPLGRSVAAAGQIASLSGSLAIGPQNGEALQDATQRVLGALSGFSARQGNVCVVSHGHVIQSVINTLVGNNADHFERYAHLNGAYSILTCPEKGLTVEKWGISTHLFSRSRQ